MPERDAFVHEAMFYASLDGYLDATTRFIREAVAAGEPVLVAAPPANIQAVRDRLYGGAGQIRFLNLADAGRNPNRIIPWVLRAFLDEHPNQRVRVVSEAIWPGRAAEEIPLAIRQEALINQAFTGRAATIFCPYDIAGLDVSVLASAGRTHPMIIDAAGRRTSIGYLDPAAVIAGLNHPLPARSTPADELTFDACGLRRVRYLVAQHAERAGLPPDRIADLKFAVNEVATNTVAYGAEPGMLRIWHQLDRIICEIRGSSELDDWPTGRLPPPDDTPRGRGLLVANRLCDLVETHFHAVNTTTRLHMRH